MLNKQIILNLKQPKQTPTHIEKQTPLWLKQGQRPKTQQIKLKMLDSDSNELPQQLHTQSNHNL